MFKKVYILCFTISLLFSNLVFWNTTTNKEFLLTTINNLEINLNNLKNEKNSSINTYVSNISNNYEKTFNDLWYDLKVINWLVQLWKIDNDFRINLVSEANSLINEINTKIITEINSLLNIKTLINSKINISDIEKQTFLTGISGVDNNYNDLKSIFNTKNNTLTTKYNTLFNNFKNSITQIVSSNQNTIKLFDDVIKKYNNILLKSNDFENKYIQFNDKYILYSWELKNFSNDKQRQYVELLNIELLKIKVANFNANKSLEKYDLEINRLINILVENFKNSLYFLIEEDYWIIYWENNILWIKTNLLNYKNKYFNIDWDIRATDILSNSWIVINQINDLSKNLNEIDLKITNLLNNNSTNLDNIKTVHENKIIDFYNKNYEIYKNDLFLKLKEKIDILNIENKSIIQSVDIIDLRYSLFKDKIKNITNQATLKKEIEEFKSEMKRYDYLNNNYLNNKINSINFWLEIMLLNIELTKKEYIKLKNKNKNVFYNSFVNQSKKENFDINNLISLNNKLNQILDLKIKVSTKFLFLNFKLEILTFLQDYIK